jgi:hypothetical protein
MSPMTCEEAERETIRRWGPGAMAWCSVLVVGCVECVVGPGGAHQLAVAAYRACGKGRTFEMAFKDAESRGHGGTR